jgi:hypothetical protein
MSNALRLILNTEMSNMLSSLYCILNKGAEYMERNIEAHSCTYFCSEKKVLHVLRVFCSLRYPSCNAHALYCHLWPARLYSIFPPFLINGTTFRKELLNIKCVFWFSLQSFCEIFFVIEELSEKWSKMFIVIYVKYLLFMSGCYETWILWIDFWKILRY